METGVSSQPQPTPNRTSPLLIFLVLAALLAVAFFWYRSSQSSTTEIKHAFAIDHAFDDPVVFFDGKGLQFDVMAFDRRLVKVYVPRQELATPKYLLAEDGELDFLGLVKQGQNFIPLQLFQIHNDRPGRPESPVTDCKTYLEVPSAAADTVLVLIDGKHILKGVKTGPNVYMINFCETTREHTFQILGPYGTGSMAMKGQMPMTYSLNGSSGRYRYQIRGSGDTIRMPQAPATYALAGKPAAKSALAPAMYSTEQDRKSAVTKVIFSMPRSLESPWVYLNEKRISNFTLNSARNQVIFWVKQNGQPVEVRVGDNNCECQASGRAIHPVLELRGYCECRDIQVVVNLDRGLDRYRNKIRIYVDGQLTDISLPPAGQPLVFPVRKTNRDQFVEMKLILPDDSGRAGLFDLCSFTVPTEATTVNLNPSCICTECPPNIKVSG